MKRQNPSSKEALQSKECRYLELINDFIVPVIPDDFRHIGVFYADYGRGECGAFSIYSNSKIALNISWAVDYIAAYLYEEPIKMAANDDGTFFPYTPRFVGMNDLALMTCGSLDDFLLKDCERFPVSKAKKRAKLIAENTSEVFGNVASVIQKYALRYLNGSAEPDFDKWVSFRLARRNRG